MKYMNYKKMSTEKILSRISDGEERWGYMTALRGPDSGDEIIKRLFTCFIRGECYVSWGINFFDDLICRIYRIDKKDCEDQIAIDITGFLNVSRTRFLIELGIVLGGMNNHYKSHVLHGLKVIASHFTGEVRHIANNLYTICDYTYTSDDDATQFLNGYLEAIAAIVCK